MTIILDLYRVKHFLRCLLQFKLAVYNVKVSNLAGFPNVTIMTPFFNGRHLVGIPSIIAQHAVTGPQCAHVCIHHNVNPTCLWSCLYLTPQITVGRFSYCGLGVGTVNLIEVKLVLCNPQIVLNLVIFANCEKIITPYFPECGAHNLCQSPLCPGAHLENKQFDLALKWGNVVFFSRIMIMVFIIALTETSGVGHFSTRLLCLWNTRIRRYEVRIFVVFD